MKQSHIEKFSRKSEEYILICSHYEWIDERIFSIFPDIHSVSIWDYVLSSWELASVVWIDSVVRLLPGVINAKSLEEESFSKKLNRKKEYPQYTRPNNFLWYEVPGELLSGDKKVIENWKNKYY
jgi:tRNA (guanine37-N1)-methyltransferase